MKAVLRRHWALSAEIARLDAEYDANFRVDASDESFVLKVMRQGCDPDFVRMQIAAIEHLRTADPAIPVPGIVPDVNGGKFVEFTGHQGFPRIAWMQVWMPGLRLADFKPRSGGLHFALGRMAGRIANGLRGFDHPLLRRIFKWNPLQASWIKAQYPSVADPQRRDLVHSILAGYHAAAEVLETLPTQAIHNDLNDCNVLVAPTLNGPPAIGGVLDFGDMCRAPRICELANAAAYAVLGQPDPDRVLGAMISGFHSASPLTATEIDLLWPLLCMRLAVSVVNSTLMARCKPDDPYVTISQAPAWEFLESNRVDPTLLRARLRVACGLAVVEDAPDIRAWLDGRRGTFAPILGRRLSGAPILSLAVGECPVPADPFHLTDAEAACLASDDGAGFRIGRYGEPRLIYTGRSFRKGDLKTSERRTVHLGVDVFASSGTPVAAPCDGWVQRVENRTVKLDYGGVVVLCHECAAGSFFTLYGHLDPECVDRLVPGSRIAAGIAFARLGNAAQSGGWQPHLHFQLAMAIDGIDGDWPGVADPDDLELWKSLCPNPAALLNLPDKGTGCSVPEKARIRAHRAARFGANLSLSYRDPAMFLRGWRHYLFDEYGRTYLDAYNNVPHAGHAHPRIQSVAAEQLGLLNSNTRYLHPAQTEFAEALLARFPAQFSTCYFVNSGTEANELAIRLARSHTGGCDMIALDHGYHGNSTGTVSLSAYKFNAPGGPGQPDWVHLVDLPDDYRGTFRRDDPERGRKFAARADQAIRVIAGRGRKLAGFIAETFPSVAGQIVPPPGFLPAIYENIRASGGVCIADEVQTGLGRLGDHFFGFEQQRAVPDIVVLGKPLGNGFPVGAVVTTREIAESFARGPEFFSTFGGSTLSCRVGKTLLDIIREEGLQENAVATGRRLFAGLRELESRHAVVGDVRGMGLFAGVDLVDDPERRTPATEVAAHVRERLREQRILIGCEGPADNVLKIRPPLTIEVEDVDFLVQTLDQVLSESAISNCSGGG